MTEQEYNKLTFEEKVQYHSGCLIISIGSGKFNEELYLTLTAFARSKQNEIDSLKKRLESVYAAALEGVSYVGIANYAEREATARARIIKAYQDEGHK